MNFRLFTTFLVGFGTAFNTFAIQVGGRPLSVGLLAVALYFLSLASLPFSRNLQFYLSHVGKHLYLPLLYTFLLSLLNIIFDNGSSAIFPFAFFMDWILFLALLAHSIKDARAIDYCLYGISIGAIVLSIFFYLGIGVEINVTREGDRFSMFGSNENVLGIFQSINTCIILNLFIFCDRLKLGKFRWMFIFPLILSAAMIFATGSRTAILITVAVYGLSIWTMNTSNKFLKFFVIVSCFCGIVYAVQKFLLSDSAMAIRMLNTLQEGDTGGRTDIWLAYLNYFPQHPFFGVGNSGMIDIARASGVGTTDITGTTTALSPHNVLVEVLMTTGLVGLLIMVLFWKNVFSGAVVSLRKFHFSTPLILLVPILAVIMSGQILGEKYAWIIYAYMLAAGVGKTIETKNTNY